MPIYEYTCKGCDAKFEKLVKTMAEGDHIACPKCGSKKTEREMSVFAVGAESRPAPQCGGCASAGACPMRQ